MSSGHAGVSYCQVRVSELYLIGIAALRSTVGLRSFLKFNLILQRVLLQSHKDPIQSLMSFPQDPPPLSLSLTSFLVTSEASYISRSYVCRFLIPLSQPSNTMLRFFRLLLCSSPFSLDNSTVSEGLEDLKMSRRDAQR